MKHLTIVRHAKAERPELHLKDFVPTPHRARPQRRRAHRRDTGQVSSRRWTTSSARPRPAPPRPPSIWQLLLSMRKQSSGARKPTTRKPSPSSISSRVSPTTCHHVLLVGHNPSLEEFVSGLIGSSPEDVIVTLATASIAQLEPRSHPLGLGPLGHGTPETDGCRQIPQIAALSCTGRSHAPVSPAPARSASPIAATTTSTSPCVT